MRPSIPRLAVLSACLGAAALPVAAEAGGYTTPFGNSTIPFKPVRGC